MTANLLRKTSGTLLAGALLLGIGTGCATPKGETPEQQRTFIRNMKKETIAELLKEKPEVQKSLKSAAGYAVFSNINIKIFALGSGNGYGVAVDNKTGKETFMRMAELGVGFGLGAKDIRTVFVFKERDRFNQFVEKGWTFGAEAAASAKSKDEGGAAEGEVSLEEGIEVYQLTSAGLMASAMISGTKYWKDDDLQ